MEVLSTRLYGEARSRAHATKLYGDFLLSLSLSLQPTNTDDDDDDGCCCFFFQPKTDLFKYYHHSLITLSHSLRLRPLCSILTLHDLHFFLQPTKRKFPSIEGKFFLFHLHSWQHCFFSNLPPALPFSNLPRTLLLFQISRWRGGKSRDRGSGVGNFILEKIFTSPGIYLTTYYCYPMRAGHIILIKVNDNYRGLYKCGW